MSDAVRVRLYCAWCEAEYHQRNVQAVSIVGGNAVCFDHFRIKAKELLPTDETRDGG